MNNCFTAFVYDVYVTAELLSGLRKEVESGRLPSNIADRMEEVYHNYRNAVSNQIDLNTGWKIYFTCAFSWNFLVHLRFEFMHSICTPIHV